MKFSQLSDTITVGPVRQSKPAVKPAPKANAMPAAKKAVIAADRFSHLKGVSVMRAPVPVAPIDSDAEAAALAASIIAAGRRGVR